MTGSSLDDLSRRFPQLETLLGTFESDPSGILASGENRVKSARSLARRLESATAHHLAGQLGRLLQHGAGDLFSIFPAREEILDELLPLAEPLRAELPYQTSNLAFSAPVADRGSLSLNLIIRLYDPSRKVTVKIKIGSFVDCEDHLYWEVGFVDEKKSLQGIRRNFLSGDPSKRDYFLLARLVACTRRFIERRVNVRGLDLTPAYFHVVPLCRRLGGQAEPGFDWEGWNDRISRSFEYSLGQLPATVSGIGRAELGTLKARYLVTWLFEQGLMLEPGTERQLPWDPPRLRYPQSESRTLDSPLVDRSCMPPPSI
jgi:hypothetical protein